MLRPRSELEKKIDRLIQRYINKTELHSDLGFYMEDTYGIPLMDSLEYLHGEKRVNEMDDFTLFCLSDAFQVINGNNLVDQFYTESEIKKYKSVEKEVKTIFPLNFKMIQVSDDTWIGRTDVNELMQLQDNGLISYPESSIESFSAKPNIRNLKFVNRTVLEIQEKLHNGTFIPNAITLNIELGKGKFRYNARGYELIVNELDSFVIIDGKYRLHAIIREKNDNPDFNYPMELRITNFDDLKAKQFIYQEEMKIRKRTKSQIKSYDNTEYGNKIILRLNGDARSVLQGKINNLVSQYYLLAVINSVYLKNINNEEIDSQWLFIEQELVEIFNDYCEKYPEFLSQKQTTIQELTVIVYAYYLCKNGELNIDNPAVIAHNVIDIINADKDNEKYFIIRSDKVKNVALRLIKGVIQNEL